MNMPQGMLKFTVANEWRERVGIEPTSDVGDARQKDLKSSDTTRCHPLPLSHYAAL